MNYKLSQRLRTVVSLVTPGNSLADIGTDHGYVPIACVSEGISPFALAMDVKAGPLSIAEDHIAQQNLQDRITTRLSDGLKKLNPGEADTIVIAGMGGMLMRDILAGNPAAVRAAKELILSPQSDIEFFRAYLKDNAITIVEERMVFEEGKFYLIFRCVPGEVKNISPEEPVGIDTIWECKEAECDHDEEFAKRYGTILLKRRDEVFAEFLLAKEKEHCAILKQMEDAGINDGRTDGIRKELAVIRYGRERMKDR